MAAEAAGDVEDTIAVPCVEVCNTRAETKLKMGLRQVDWIS